MRLHAEKPAGRPLFPLVRDWSLAFEHIAVQQALAYWRSRCGTHTMPATGDISPSGMARFLPHVVLIDIQRAAGDEDHYRVRVAGTHVEEVLGPMGGRDIRSFLTPELLARWQEFFGEVRAAEKPARLTGRVSYENKTWLLGEALLAPLCDETGAVSRLFMALSFQSEKN